MEITAAGNDSCHGFGHGIHRSVIRAPGGKIRIKPVAHHGNSICFSLQDRQFCHHSLRFRKLVFSAVGHQHAGCADGGVEHFHKALLGADIQIGKQGKPCFFRITGFQRLSCFGNGVFIKIAAALRRDIHIYACLLMSSVGIQERPGNIHDFFSPPGKDEAGLLCYNRNAHGLQIFFLRIIQESIHIPGSYHNGHPFLGFGDGKLRSVQTRVFLGNLIQIHPESVRQLTDGNRYAAGTEIITLLNQPADFRPAEQPLDLTFRRRISLLYFRAAGFNTLFRMHLGGTGSAAAAVPSGASAQEDDDIARIGGFTDYIFSGSGTHNGADFHTFCHIIGMIYFFYITGCQTDLIAIRGVAVRSAADQLFLGKLSL